MPNPFILKEPPDIAKQSRQSIKACLIVSDIATGNIIAYTPLNGLNRMIHE